MTNLTAEQILDLFFPWGEPELGMRGSYRRRYPNEHGEVLMDILVRGRWVCNHEGENEPSTGSALQESSDR